MNLLVVESPNKVKKIAEILGGGWTVMASVGHIRDLPKHEVGVAAPDYRPHYRVSPEKKDVVDRLKTAAAQAESVWLATDPDREGEAIAWHLSEALGLGRGGKPVHRVSFHEISEKAVLAAVARPGTIDMAMVKAQEARRVIDRLVGYRVSPALGAGLSAGRVQSPAARLVVDREREIRDFVPSAFLEVEAAVDGSPPWKAVWDHSPFRERGQDMWTDRAVADGVAKARRLTVLSAERKRVAVRPPAPFTTSTLQQAASARLGLPPEETMRLAQNLFAAGDISYHRTDSPNLSAEAAESAMSWLRESGLPAAASRNAWKAKGGAQEAHEAVRPTHFEAREAGGTPEEQALYRLIWTRAVASQMADAIYEDTRLVLESDVPVSLAGNPKALFKANGRVLTAEKGWRGLMEEDDWDTEGKGGKGGKGGEAQAAALPLAKEGDTFPCAAAVLEKKTRPPPRYTEASLVSRLEALEIGRPSTYASIMGGIKKRKYVEVRGKALHATALGEEVVGCLEKAGFSFVTNGYTRTMEAALDAIHEGGKDYLDVVSAADQVLDRELGSMPEAVRAGRFGLGGGEPAGRCQCGGSVRESANAWQCDAPDCQAIVWKESFGRRMQKAEALALLEGKTVNLMGLVSKKPGKKPYSYSADARIAGGKVKLLLFEETAAGGGQAGGEAAPPAGACQCGGPVRESARAWQCGECGATVWKETYGRQMKKDEALALLAGKTLTKLDGFVSSKSGKAYSAGLCMEGTKAALVFEDRAGGGQQAGGEAAPPAGACQCGGPVRESAKAWQCGECGATVWKEISGRPVQPSEALALLSGDTVHLRGMTSKASGRVFSADCRIEGGKVTFLRSA